MAKQMAKHWVKLKPMVIDWEKQMDLLMVIQMEKRTRRPLA